MSAPTEFSLEGPKVLLIGPSGTGKTRSTATFADWAAKQNPQRRVFALFTENSTETFLGYWRDAGKEIPPNVHWHVSAVKPLPFSALLDGAKKTGMLAYKALTELVDPNRSTNNPALKILEILTDFEDQRTGQKFGNIDSWTHDDILIIDSLSEMANAYMKMVIGNKPTASPSDYGVAQNNLLNFLRYLTQGFKPTVILTAHVQRQVDEVSGTVKLMTKAIGKAMGDDIPQLFSEVIGCVREGPAWYWDTAATGLDTKTRYLPIASKIPPDGGTIMDKWLKRGAV